MEVERKEGREEGRKEGREGGRKHKKGFQGFYTPPLVFSGDNTMYQRVFMIHLMLSSLIKTELYFEK